MNEFAANLRLLCDKRKSVSAVCRDIGINRQQFGRYLAGSALPSKYNLGVIARHFGVPAEHLIFPRNEFATLHGGRDTEASTSVMNSPFFYRRAFPGDLQALRRYCGYWFTHFRTPRFVDAVVRGLLCLRQNGTEIQSKYIERAPGYVSKYNGTVSLLNGCIFLVEFEYLSSDSIVETILFPSYRERLDHLVGLTLGVTSRVHRQPYASKVVWKFLGEYVEVRARLKECGFVNMNSRTLDPHVRKLLSDQNAGPLSLWPDNLPPAH
jgi:hypothetical protein